MLIPICCLQLGCMSSVPPGKPRPSLDDYRVGDLVEKGSIDDWHKTFIQNPGTTTYKIVEGDNSGTTFAYIVEAKGDDAWHLSMEKLASYNWSLTDDGIVSQTYVDDPSGSTSTYDPPLLVIPKDLAPGKAVESKGKIVVTHTNRPSSRMASGTYTISILHDADVTLKIGDENVECTRIYTRYDSDLGLATVGRDSWDYYAKDRGWVATVFRQKVVKLIIPEHTTGTILRSGK